MKKTKILFFVCFFIIISAIVCVVIFSPQKADYTAPVLTESRYDKAIRDICMESYSRQYDGVYKFNLVKNISFASQLSAEQIDNIYQKYGVSNAQDLKFVIFQEKQTQYKNNLIVLNNGNYTRNKNNIPIEDGMFWGNEDYSEIRIEKSGKYVAIYEISLTGKSVETLKETVYEQDTNTYGQVLYFYEKFYDEFNKHIFTACYCFNLVF